MSTAPAAPASTDEALAMLISSLGFLAAADPTQMSAVKQAECLQALERADAVETAARAQVLGAFTAAQGHTEDGDYSPKSWLIHQTRITRGAATGHTARTLCQWTDKLPEKCRDAADAVLAAAACKGMDLRDLAALAAEIQSRSCPDPGPDDPGRSFEDRAVRLETTFAGAGILSGDLSPECAALVGTVLDALSAPRGAEDDRSHAQRYHDGLQEAMNRLVASGMLPDRAGQPAKVLAHISLADLIVLDADSKLQDQWIERVRSEWAGHRAAASVGGSDGAAWLEGEEAEGFACDASITPIVFGEVNPAVMNDMVRLCVQLAAYGHRHPGTGDSAQDSASADSAPVPPAVDPQTSPVPPGFRSREALEREIIRKAIALVSGPSLPLDIGYSDDVPTAIRNAVKARDKFCQRAGGCHQGAAACQVHHLKHKAAAASPAWTTAFFSAGITTRS